MYAGSTRDLREIAREMRRREFFWGISRNPPPTEVRSSKDQVAGPGLLDLAGTTHRAFDLKEASEPPAIQHSGLGRRLVHVDVPIVLFALYRSSRAGPLVWALAATRASPSSAMGPTSCR